MYLYSVENKEQTKKREDMKLDKYKQDILDKYINTTSNIFIKASAGTGKTTMLLRLLEATPSYKDCLFLAFNKSIVEELDRRIMGRAEVKTIHSKAFSTLLRSVRCRFKLSKWRDFSLCKQFVHFDEHLTDKQCNQRIMNLSAIWNLMRINLVDIDEPDQIEKICLRWDIDFDSTYYKELQVFVSKLRESQNNLKINTLDIDFTDQLWLTYMYVPEELYPKYDVVFCDEAQDLNPLQRELILRMLKPNGRLVSVGDYFQCIFSFQGSSTDSFALLENRPNTLSLPLNVSYRCAKSIVEMARRYSPEIEACEDAEEGFVGAATLNDVNQGDYILCRNNLPLVQAFIFFLKKKKQAVILGKDFGEQLIRILEQVERPQELLGLLRKKREELKEQGIQNIEANESYAALLEKISILQILIRETLSFNKTKEMIMEIFQDTENKDYILLSTIHKSKGLEADRVFILGFHELIPSKYARTELALYSEKCLQFVAVTRAKKSLFFIPYNAKQNEETETVC